jgi:hypothetical protein
MTMNSPPRVTAPAGLIAILMYLLVVGALLLGLTGESALVVLIVRHVY